MRRNNVLTTSLRPHELEEPQLSSIHTGLNDLLESSISKPPLGMGYQVPDKLHESHDQNTSSRAVEMDTLVSQR